VPAPARIVDQKLGALIGVGCLLGLTLAAWRSVTAGREAPPAAQHRSRPPAAAAPAPGSPAASGPVPGLPASSGPEPHASA